MNTQDGWTSEPPTVVGVYGWRKNQEDEPQAVIVAMFYGKLCSDYRGKYSMQFDPCCDMGGLWRRLVPAVEVERAWNEGRDSIQSQYPIRQRAWQESRAKKVMEGTEQFPATTTAQTSPRLAGETRPDRDNDAQAPVAPLDTNQELAITKPGCGRV